MNNIFLVKQDAKKKAEDALADLRDGKDITLDSLEVIDELLQIAKPKDKSKFTIWSGSDSISWTLLERMRFQRGLDPRS